MAAAAKTNVRKVRCKMDIVNFPRFPKVTHCPATVRPSVLDWFVLLVSELSLGEIESV